MSIDQKPSEQQTGADIVVKTLEQQNVKWVFGIPGAKIDKVFNTLVDSSIQTVVCRHEQNAAFIAGGIGRMTGKAGVAIATSGPGVSNLVTGLATANTEGDPMIALGGAVPLADRLKKIHQSDGLREPLQSRDEVQCRSRVSGVRLGSTGECISERRVRSARSCVCQSSDGHHDGICQV